MQWFLDAWSPLNHRRIETMLVKSRTFPARLSPGGNTRTFSTARLQAPLALATCMFANSRSFGSLRRHSDAPLAVEKVVMRSAYLAHAAIWLVSALPCSAALAQGRVDLPLAAHDWSGWYLGVNAGWAKRTEISHPPASFYESLGTGLTFNDGSTAPSDSNDRDSFTAGVGLAYQRQFDWLVLGANGDVLYSDFASHRGSQSSFSFHPPVAGLPMFGPLAAGDFTPDEGRSNRLITLARLRAGIALDRWLLFAAAGGAYRPTNRTTDPYLVDAVGVRTVYSGFGTSDRWGWVLGGGAEYAFAQGFTLSVEYMRIDFGAGSYVDPIASYATNSPVIHKYDREIDVVRAGINVQLDGLLVGGR
jgi:outer membrane immunogenic protein